MHQKEFTLEQKKVIEQLREASAKCQEMKVMVAEFIDYSAFETVDSTGKPFISMF